MPQLPCVRCLDERCICGRGKFLMHEISCWGFSASNPALQGCSFRSLRPSLQKSKSSLYLSHSINPSNNKCKSLSTDALPCCWEGECSSQTHGGCNHRAPCLHHVPRTEEGSSKVFMCSAHLRETQMIFYFSFSTANIGSHQAEGLWELSWDVLKSDAG